MWDDVLAAETDPIVAATVKAPAAKTFAVDAAIRNAERTAQIHGGYGLTAEYRYLNDAWVGWSCDVTRDMLMLEIASTV